MAINPPGAIQILPAVDQRLWDFLMARPTISIPIKAESASRVLQSGSCIFMGYSIRNVPGAVIINVEFLDGLDATGEAVAEVVVPSTLNTFVFTDTDIDASSAVAAAANNVTLAGVAGQTTFITGFEITGDGATAGSIITITITGVLGGTKTYFLTIPAGVTTAITPLIVEFARPIPASAVNTAIVVNVPSFGAGNTNAAVTAHGFQRATTVVGQANQGSQTTSLGGQPVFCRRGLFMNVIAAPVTGAVWVKM